MFPGLVGITFDPSDNYPQTSQNTPGNIHQTAPNIIDGYEIIHRYDRYAHKWYIQTRVYNPTATDPDKLLRMRRSRTGMHQNMARGEDVIRGGPPPG